MRLSLIVQSDAPDFDLWAQVLMVLPDGFAVKLGEDIRRARFRNDYFKSERLKPDQVAEISVRLLLDGSENSDRSAPASHPSASEFARVPKELQHWRTDRLRADRRCSDRYHQNLPRCPARELFDAAPCCASHSNG